jgi:hypothetical protein
MSNTRVLKLPVLKRGLHRMSCQTLTVIQRYLFTRLLSMLRANVLIIKSIRCPSVLPQLGAQKEMLLETSEDNIRP